MSTLLAKEEREGATDLGENQRASEVGGRVPSEHGGRRRGTDERAQVATRRESQLRPNTAKQICGAKWRRRATLVLRLPPNLHRAPELPGQRTYDLNDGMGMEEGQTKV